MRNQPSTRTDGIDLKALIGRQRPGFSLDGDFYRSAEIYERDLERVFMRLWLYAGHHSQIPEVGDYFLFEIGAESIIVNRGEDGTVNALVNVCRHRGSRVCLESSGNATTLICPYHGWTYGLRGELLSKRAMGVGFERQHYGLKHIQVKVLHGLIFVNFDQHPLDLGAATLPLEPCLAPYRLDHTKAASISRYSIDANWKLAVENYVECYHCAPAHPEYALVHTRKAPASRSDKLRNEMLEQASKAKLVNDTIDRTGLDASPWGSDIFYERTPLYSGYKSGSQDGRPVAPLLGDLDHYDVGSADIEIGPLNHILIYPDYAVVYSFIPRGPQRCEMRLTWLVNEYAEAGKDYDLERLTWLWDVTSNADKRIIDHNQKGVNSRFYEGGPYSEMEPFTRKFVEWYLHSIA